MRDWSRLVSERMGVLALSGAVRDEVVAELATHLEELYQACRARGASESQAIEIALSQATTGRSWDARSPISKTRRLE